jgi:hypothetical protein
MEYPLVLYYLGMSNLRTGQRGDEVAANRKPSELQQAVILLLNNQAALVSEMREHAREMREHAREMNEIRRTLDGIIAILNRHETILANLPEAIQQRIGFARP